LKIYISQGSATAQLRCSGAVLQIFHRICRRKKLKIGQYLATIWIKVCGLLLGHPVYLVVRTWICFYFLYVCINIVMDEVSDLNNKPIRGLIMHRHIAYLNCWSIEQL